MSYARARRAYQSTSADAWHSMQAHLGEIDGGIMWCVSDYPKNGRTCDEIERSLCLSHQTVSAQIRHLVKAGLLEDSGQTRPTSSGRQAIVWRLAAKSDAGRLPLDGGTDEHV